MCTNAWLFVTGVFHSDFIVETWERHRLWGIKYHCLLTSILQLTESASLPIPVYLVLNVFHICLFTTKVVFFPRETTPKKRFPDMLPHLKRCLLNRPLYLSWPSPFFTGTSCIALKNAGPKSGLETSNANDTHSLALLTQQTSIVSCSNIIKTAHPSAEPS